MMHLRHKHVGFIHEHACGGHTTNRTVEERLVRQYPQTMDYSVTTVKQYFDESEFANPCRKLNSNILLMCFPGFILALIKRVTWPVLWGLPAKPTLYVRIWVSACMRNCKRAWLLQYIFSQGHCSVRRCGAYAARKLSGGSATLGILRSYYCGKYAGLLSWRRMASVDVKARHNGLIILFPHESWQ